MPFLKCAGHALDTSGSRRRGEADAGVPARRAGLDRAVARLSAGWRGNRLRALVYDRYGYGNSDVSRRSGWRRVHARRGAGLAAGAAGGLEIESPILVGHSDGASIALIHAGAGYRVRGVAVMAPHVFVEDIGLEASSAVKVEFETTYLPERLGSYHRDERKTFHLWNDAWLDPAVQATGISRSTCRVKCRCSRSRAWTTNTGRWRN